MLQTGRCHINCSREESAPAMRPFVRILWPLVLLLHACGRLFPITNTIWNVWDLQTSATEIRLSREATSLLDIWIKSINGTIEQRTGIVIWIIWASRIITTLHTSSPYEKLSTHSLLHRPRQRWRTVVMNTSVCLSVCSRAYLPNYARDIYQTLCACCLWPWLGPPSNWAICGFSSSLTMHCIA